jgi:replicative DNA helicase
VSDRVVELPAPNRSSSPHSESPFERTPPQDVAAEQSVLGGMLLSKDAIADVVEVVRANDFYRPAHQTIFDVIVDLYGKGEPADPITVSAELTRLGEIGRVGGAPYLHTLLSSVPTAANAGFYARIVQEQAVLRRLVEAGTRIVQLGYGASGGDVDDVVDRAQQSIYDGTERRSSEDYTLLEELMQPTMDELEAIGTRGGGMSGVPTGFADLDGLTNGLHPGQLIVIAGRPGLGKALALDTALPTPTGWTTMGAVRVGDQLLAGDGRPTTVVAATDVMVGRPCFEVTFSDGTTVVADAEHQWLTETRASRRAVGGGAAAVRTTAQIAETVRCVTADARANHSIRTAAPLQLPEADLPLSPYALGVWLGDGHSAGARITTADPEIVMHLEAEGLVVTRQGGALLYGVHLPAAEVSARPCAICGAPFIPKASQVVTCGRSCGGRAKGLGGSPCCPDWGGPSSGLARCATCRAEHGTVQGLLRTLGVLGDKHVPAAYLRASEGQRRDLLAGLMDTDGTVTSTGNLQFAVTSERLAQGVHELVLTLGHRCTVTRNAVRGRHESSSTCFILNWTTDERVFRLERKHLLHKELSRMTPARVGQRWITAVTRVPSVPVRCVEVDNADHLYLATRSMVPTHNSTLGLDIARSASVKSGQASCIFSLEMSKTEITMRLLSAEARVPLHHMRAGTMTDDDWTRLARRMGEVADAPLYIDDSPNLTMMEIRSKARRLRQRHDLRLVVIDYLQLMSGNKKAESRQQEVSELSRNLKLLAKELEVPVIAMSQLNRGAEQRTDKKPQLSDLRESGCLPATTKILRADTGGEVTLGELFASGEKDVPVWSLDDSLRYVRRHLTHVFSTGRRQVFGLALASGKQVTATANHPFLGYAGWRPLGELAVGDRVAVPRHVPAPLQQAEWSDEQVLAHAEQTAARGAQSRAAAQKVAHLPKAQIRLFLRRLWQLAGHPSPTGAGAPPVLLLGAQVLDDVSRLLLRFGISVLRASDPESLAIVEHADAVRFWTEIALAAPQEEPFGRRGPVDTVPDQVWERVRAALGSRQAVTPGGGALPQVAGALDEAGLELEATNDVLWDTVVAIEPLGEQDVYDATVVGTHNFVADGVAVHNSIEQDADMVILLHREDAYEKESPRAGEADFIVAKHRNGPTSTITVAFQGHYSRFVDMNPG